MTWRLSQHLTVIGLALIVATSMISAACAQDVPSRSERFYQERFCAGLDLKIRLGLQRRADCISSTHAIEVDWHDKWKEAIGQALAYSAETGLRLGIILVCRSDQAYCLSSSLFVRQTLSYHRVAATLWDCLPIDETLEACTRWEIAD